MRIADERQLTTLFEKLTGKVRDTHKKIHIELAGRYKEKGMTEAAQACHAIAQLLCEPEIPLEKIDVYGGEEFQFKLVDELLAATFLSAAEAVLEKMAAEHMEAKQKHQLFSEQPIIRNVIDNWYCDVSSIPDAYPAMKELRQS